MTRLSDEEIQYLTHQIYQLRYADPWVSNKKVAKLMNHSIASVNRYAHKAEETEVITSPKPRLKPSPKKRGTLLLFEDKYRILNECSDYDGLTFLSVYQGDWNILALYDKPTNFREFPGYIRTVGEGLLGQIFAPLVRSTTWEKAFHSIETLMEQGETRESSCLDVTPHYPQWDEEDWILYHYFYDDLRKNFSNLRKRSPISWRKYIEWKKTLREYCTILSCYYPRGYDIYNSITMCFHTHYEKYIVGLFSHLPTSPLFFKIGKYLLVDLRYPKDPAKEFRMFRITSQLKELGIITDYHDGHGILYCPIDYLDR
ncbi:MAG: hypothetical protein HXS51_02295 [Theionarchaea archaeon]|nr:hypothetical protein [Theionarchaea archaeon]